MDPDQQYRDFLGDLHDAAKKRIAKRKIQRMTKQLAANIEKDIIGHRVEPSKFVYRTDVGGIKRECFGSPNQNFFEWHYAVMMLAVEQSLRLLPENLQTRVLLYVSNRILNPLYLLSELIVFNLVDGSRLFAYIKSGQLDPNPSRKCLPNAWNWDLTWDKTMVLQSSDVSVNMEQSIDAFGDRARQYWDQFNGDSATDSDEFRARKNQTMRHHFTEYRYLAFRNGLNVLKDTLMRTGYMTEFDDKLTRQQQKPVPDEYTVNLSGDRQWNPDSARWPNFRFSYKINIFEGFDYAEAKAEYKAFVHAFNARNLDGKKRDEDLKGWEFMGPNFPGIRHEAFCWRLFDVKSMLDTTFHASIFRLTQPVAMYARLVFYGLRSWEEFHEEIEKSEFMFMKIIQFLERPIAIDDQNPGLGVSHFFDSQQVSGEQIEHLTTFLYVAATKFRTIDGDAMHVETRQQNWDNPRTYHPDGNLHGNQKPNKDFPNGKFPFIPIPKLP